MSGNATLARPYAVAAFDHAKENDAVAAWSDQLAFLALAISDADMQALIANPKFGRARLETFLLDLVKDRFDIGFQNFVRILVENGRIPVAPEIAETFVVLCARDNERTDVQVTSAYDLTQAQSDAIASAMRAKFGHEVNLSAATDPGLIGGMLIRAGDLVIDASLRGRMTQLSLDLAH